jgi:enamine deaminase RidA (YjgF/YER057c/UK114 family)
MGAATEPGAIEIIHHEGYDPAVNSLYVPAIRSNGFLFVSGLTAAPVYHYHPHRPEEFDSIPAEAAEQARIAFEHLDLVLQAGGSQRTRVVSLTRFFTNVGDDQDAVNRIQGEYFQGHLPTSTSVEVKRLATDPRLRLEIQAIAAVGDAEPIVVLPTR